MKRLLYIIPVLVVGFSSHAQIDNKPQKTIDSVKAVQLDKQNDRTVETRMMDQDALPLKKEQAQTINENNKINDHNNSINGNSIDTNDKKNGTNTVRYPAKRGNQRVNAKINNKVQDPSISDSVLKPEKLR